jgi:hypothetical protein
MIAALVRRCLPWQKIRQRVIYVMIVDEFAMADYPTDAALLFGSDSWSFPAGGRCG